MLKTFLLRGMMEMRNLAKSGFGRKIQNMQECTVHFIGKVNNSHLTSKPEFHFPQFDNIFLIGLKFTFINNGFNFIQRLLNPKCYLAGNTSLQVKILWKIV